MLCLSHPGIVVKQAIFKLALIVLQAGNLWRNMCGHPLISLS